MWSQLYIVLSEVILFIGVAFTRYSLCGVYLISPSLGGKYGHIHFKNEETETQKGEVTYLRSHNK